MNITLSERHQFWVTHLPFRFVFRSVRKEVRQQCQIRGAGASFEFQVESCGEFARVHSSKVNADRGELPPFFLEPAKIKAALTHSAHHADAAFQCHWVSNMVEG